jgi:hypothetical protein
MSTQHQRRGPRPIRRRLALATAVISALAIAAPAPGASAATPVKVWPSAVWAWPYSGTGEFVYGGLVVADVFNGGTTSVVSTGAAQGNTIGSP